MGACQHCGREGRHAPSCWDRNEDGTSVNLTLPPPPGPDYPDKRGHVSGIDLLDYREQAWLNENPIGGEVVT